MTPLGLGNDLGGSLRLPSQMCGTAALRPSRGRVAEGAVTEPAVPADLDPDDDDCRGRWRAASPTCGWRSSIISAPDARDPRWVPAPLQGPAVDGPIRVAVVRDPLGAGIDPHVRAGIDRAADWLADAGYEVVDAEPPQIAEATARVGRRDLRRRRHHLAGHGAGRRTRRDRVHRRVHGAGRVQARRPGGAARRLGRRLPASARPGRSSCRTTRSCSPRCAASVRGVIGEDISRVGEIAMAMRMVVPVNILGLPSCAVPVGCRRRPARRACS